MLTQTQIDNLKTTLIARWNAGLALSKEDWKLVAKLVNSNGASNTYAWLTQFPVFREWVGARFHKAVAERAYHVKNRKFEATIDVSVDDIDDDNLGQYGTLAEGAGQSSIDLKNDLVYQALAAGFSSECYDGQYFFDTDHPTYANEDGTGSLVTVSNMQAGAGAPWILLCTKRAPAPIYLQERMKPRFDMLTAVQSDRNFDYDQISFGGKWRGDAAYGFWQCAFGSKADLTAANFEAAYDAMGDFKGDGQRKLGILADTLVVGLANRAAAEAILTKANLAGGESNTNYKRVELIVTPWL
ncbi:Mu-like prophage major head subunit gpT family protein [Azospira sp. APE16]|uniref:Mu-like prophage major head subunit gpT family protein n=1 Tax=Azospira sp. APE16 TaxID=3394231 RepID=UPI003A4E0652